MFLAGHKGLMVLLLAIWRFVDGLDNLPQKMNSPRFLAWFGEYFFGPIPRPRFPHRTKFEGFES